MRLAGIACSAVLAYATTLFAQPAGSGSGGEIEIEPEGSASGSGSANGSNGSAAATPDQPAAPVKDPKVARRWLSAAQTLVQKGDYYTRANKPADAKAQYDNAVTAYGKAIEASDDVSLYLQLAAAEDKGGAPDEAYKHVKLVTTAQPPVKPDVLKKAQQKLDELSGKVGLLTLTVTPPGTAIKIGDKQVGEAPMTDALVLMPGTITFSFEAGGFQPKTADFKIEAGSESERKVALEPVPVTIQPHEPEPAPETPAVAAGPSKLPLYVGAGATAGLVIVATITGISAISQHSTYVDPKTSSADRKDAQSAGTTYAHVTDLCLVGALAGAAFTAYWWQYKYQPQVRAAKEHPAAAKVDVAPWVQPTAGGLTVVGSF